VAGKFHFGEFTLDESRYRLQRGDRLLRLEKRPMDLLILLVERRGELVSRDEIALKLWGKDVFVDVEHSINTAVRKVRQVLHDDPDKPRFVETVVGKGYRFATPVLWNNAESSQTAQAEEPPQLAQVTAEPAAPSLKSPGRSQHTWVAIGVAAWILVGSAVAALVVLNAFLKIDSLRNHRTGYQPIQIRSIVILPLANLSGDPAQEYFSDGMTDELITEIAQVGSLRVISRTSAMHYKGTAKTAPEIAKELNVDSVLEGSVARSGDHVRITTKLIEARADEHLWARSYEGESKDALEMQDAVARDVVTQIRLRLTTREQERLSRSRPVNPAAHDAYLKGLFYWNKRDRVSLEKAIEYFNEAIAIDPNYALPYAGVAQSYIPLTFFGYVRGIDVRPKVASALTKALDLDDSLAEAHTALGSAKHFYEYDWAGAEQEFKRAIELNPSYATAHQWYAQMLGAEGRGDEALAEHRRALALDPFSLIIISGTGSRLYRLRRYEEAAAALKDAVEMNNNFPSPHWNLGLVYAQQKEFPAAVRELQQANTLFQGDALVLGALGYTYAASGDTTRARMVLLRLEKQRRQQYVDPEAFALIYAGLGNKDRAFEWLRRAVDDRQGWVTFVKAEPMLDNLRSDPRFEDLLRRVRLTP